MPVVVNEMDVVPAAQEAAPAGAVGELRPEPKPDPREIERAVSRWIERLARVRAH
jgi:hypothetical protein